eukprot:Gb_13387 [translate_table: standard]
MDFVGTSGGLDVKKAQSSVKAESESGSIGTETFRIDDLLDFSNEDIGGPIGNDGNNQEAAVSERTSDSSVTETEAAEESSPCLRIPNIVEADGPPPSELYVPTDALEELEWLSSFIDDSLSTAEAQEFVPSTCALSPTKHAAQENQCIKQSSPVSVLESTGNDRTWILGPRILVPGRARSKRSRSSNFSFYNKPSFESRPTVLVDFFLQSCSRVEASLHSSRPPAKKAKKGSQIKTAQDGSQARRCSHCLVQKTPQWRTGPLGPKTLCNACGVRFKSGRLLPEYRPALSPTFSNEIHSNCHRKVVEIRRQKEHQQLQAQQTPPSSLKPGETSSASVDKMQEEGASNFMN